MSVEYLHRMLSLSTMSPPSTPRGPIFSPRQEHNQMAWCYRTFSLASPTKRIKLEPVDPNRSAALRKPSINPIQPAVNNGSKNTLLRSATLASRRLRRNAPAKLPLDKSAAEAPLLVGSPGVSSTGLSPIVKGLSLGMDKRQNTPTPLSTQKFAAAESKPQQPMRFRLQKPAPAKSVAKTEKASKVPKLKLGAATGLVSPPSETVPSTASRGRSRPPALSLAAAPLASAGIDLSQGMPQTPGTATGSFNLVGDAMFGEASPSLYAQPTPPPIEGAPVFEITPPSPATVLVPETNAIEQAAASSLAPCTPPWPKSGSSLRKTIFDHIGQNQLSPMDMRGYMAISMNS